MLDAVREFDAKAIVEATRSLNLAQRGRERLSPKQVRRLLTPLRSHRTWLTNTYDLPDGTLVEVVRRGQETADALIRERQHGGFYSWSASIRTYWLDLPQETWYNVRT